MTSNFLHLDVLERSFSWSYFNNNNIISSSVTHFNSSSFTTRRELPHLVVDEDYKRTFRLERVQAPRH